MGEKVELWAVRVWGSLSPKIVSRVQGQLPGKPSFRQDLLARCGVRYGSHMSNPSVSPESIGNIMSAVLRLGRCLRANRPFDSIPLSALALLTTLNREGPMPAARLAECERLKPQSLSRLLKDLDEAGLIGRESGPDKRTLLISVTESGRMAIFQDMASRHAWLSEAMKNTLSLEEQLQLAMAAELMQKVAKSER